MTRPSAKDLIHQATTPRWLLVLVALLAFIVATIFLGLWQWERTNDILRAERAAAAEPVPIQELINPDLTWDNNNIGRPVILDGNFTEDQLALPNREFDQQSGDWIVTRFELNNNQSVAVVRGWLPTDPASPAHAPISTVPTQVTGVLHPDEQFYEGANTQDILTMDHTALANEWNTELIPGFVMLSEFPIELVPADASAPVIVPPTVDVGDVAFPLQNFFYAFQWWLFGLFAIAVYLRWLWVDAKTAKAEQHLRDTP